MKGVYRGADARFEQLVTKTCDFAFKFGMPIFFLPQMINSYIAYYSAESAASIGESFRLVIRVT